MKGGKDVKKNYSKAKEYFEKTIEAGKPDLGYSGLATLYINGFGVRKNFTKAASYYNKELEYKPDS